MGALNASKMKFNFDERIQTNAMANFTQIYEYEKFTHQKKVSVWEFRAWLNYRHA